MLQNCGIDAHSRFIQTFDKTINVLQRHLVSPLQKSAIGPHIHYRDERHSVNGLSQP